jgi:hypothetical protein
MANFHGLHLLPTTPLYAGESSSAETTELESRISDQVAVNKELLAKLSGRYDTLCDKLTNLVT